MDIVSHLGAQHAFFEFCVRIIYQRKVAHGDYGRHCLFVDITCSIKHATADVEVGQRGPKFTSFVAKGLYSSSNNRVDIDCFDACRVLCEHFA